MELFLKNLKGGNILDLGSGPGRDALFFKERGFNPVCVDISSKMVKVCRSKGLDACLMDIENLGFANSSFDGIWAYASLLHLPKRNMPQVFHNLNCILKDNGFLFIGMKEGDYQGYIPNQLVPIYSKFMAMYYDAELKNLLESNFEIMNFSRSKIDEHSVYLNYLCKKLSS